MKGLRALVYGLYQRRISASLAIDQVPRHVAVIIDGNRRWARARPMSGNVAEGHQAGADKIHEFLDWCDEIGVDVVTIYLMSTDNLGRSPDELDPLLRIIGGLVEELARSGRWRVRQVGALDLLPTSTARVLKEAEDRTAQVSGMTVNCAAGYGGREELTAAVRSLLLDHAHQGTTIEELAERLDVDDIANHLYTKGQPDPDLLIRTSGEQRLSGFLLWQSAYSEFYFCEAFWPDFRKVDFLRAIRAYAARHRRYGR